MSELTDARKLFEEVEGMIDFRPDENIYRVARESLTSAEIFDLEMEYLFESTWIYACHESQIANKHDFVTVTIGRQPVIITRGAKGEINALINACAHRGTTLTRVCKGNQSTFTCPFHAWCYKTDGRLVKVKAQEEYHEGFNKAEHNLSKALVESYKGFVFVNLNTACTEPLEDFLGDAKIGFDMMVAQSSTEELEVLPGYSPYNYDGNWKLQLENGMDAYHVTTVHYNYVATVQYRQQLDAEKNDGSQKKVLDYSKLGSGDDATDDGWFAFSNGHGMLHSDMPNAADVRPGYDAVMPRLKEEHGEDMAHWIMHRLRNLSIYPSLFFMDQISSQLRVVRPVAWNKTEIHSFCIGVKDESPKDRENRIRQFEDFFNVSGMGTADDLVQFREAQRGFEGRMAKWNDISRGCEKWGSKPTKHTQLLNISPEIVGTEITHEGVFVNQQRTWQKAILAGLAKKIEKLEGATS